ncbi:MAG TPA: hypothetical protein VN539_02345, partial [Candidatus Saccharimonadales bacterium]|nr:hypothetical protein [Candidatus Saccharimonadales bacterium]
MKSPRLSWIRLFLAAIAALQLMPGSALGKWQGYTVPYPIPGGSGYVADCYPQYVDSHGTLWLLFRYSSPNGGRWGFYRFDGETWTPTPEDWPFEVQPGFFEHPTEDTAGNLWVGRVRWDGNSWRRFTQADGLADSSAG